MHYTSKLFGFINNKFLKEKIFNKKENFKSAVHIILLKVKVFFLMLFNAAANNN